MPKRKVDDLTAPSNTQTTPPAVSTKKTAQPNRRKVNADKQRENNAPKKPRGKPFSKGNRYQWPKGVSGNPAGRPKVKTLSEAYRAYLAEVDPDDEMERTRAEIAAACIYEIIKKKRMGAIMAAKEMADRTEGKPRQAVEIDAKQGAAQRLALLLGVSPEELQTDANR